MIRGRVAADQLTANHPTLPIAATYRADRIIGRETRKYHLACIRRRGHNPRVHFSPGPGSPRRPGMPGRPYRRRVSLPPQARFGRASMNEVGDDGGLVPRRRGRDPDVRGRPRETHLRVHRRARPLPEVCTTKGAATDAIAERTGWRMRNAASRSASPTRVVVTIVRPWPLPHFHLAPVSESSPRRPCRRTVPSRPLPESP